MLKSKASARVVNTLLMELDGLDARKSVYVIAATNPPDMIDLAMCRPGRLDKPLYVDLPSADERAEIVRKMTRKVPLGARSDRETVEQTIDALVRERGEGYSGAHLAALVRKAGVVALKRTLGALDGLDGGQSGVEQEVQGVVVLVEDFVQAVEKVQASVSAARIAQLCKLDLLKHPNFRRCWERMKRRMRKVIDGSQINFRK